MGRFILGATTGLVISTAIATVLSLAFPPVTAETTAQAEAAPEVKPTTPKIETDTDVAMIDAPQASSPQTVSTEAAAKARGAFNALLVKAVSPTAVIPDVSDAQVVASANAADAFRQATGAVPDATAEGASSLINLSDTPTLANAPLREVKQSYFEVWDDLMQRCYDTVAAQEPMNEDGLTTKGSERINYTETYSEQTWFSQDKAFSVKVKTFGGDTASGVLRTCILKSNRFALANKLAVSQLKGRFHEWWARERMAQATTDLEYPYTLSDQHKWYGGLTRFGSAQGCPIKVEFSEITIGKETDASLFLTETDRNGCEATAGSSKGPGGKVRVNRLPQAGN